MQMPGHAGPGSSRQHRDAYRRHPVGPQAGKGQGASAPARQPSALRAGLPGRSPALFPTDWKWRRHPAPRPTGCEGVHRGGPLSATARSGIQSQSKAMVFRAEPPTMVRALQVDPLNLNPGLGGQ